MKARWEKRDLDDMRGAYLSFTPEDLILIDHGMDRRGVRGHSAE